MNHNLKILSPHFHAVVAGIKKFEVRDNADRGFQRGDLVTLIEVIDGVMCAAPTGREQVVEITYVSNYNQHENQVVFSFNLI